MRYPAASDDAYRLRLEGRAEKLEVARVRLVALHQLLAAFRWRSRLREQTALLRETASSQREVEEALTAVTRRAAAESWATDSAVMRCATEVEKLSNRVAALALRRLGPVARQEGLPQRLERLECVVLAAPRLVLPGQRWKTAQQVLPLSLNEVQAVARFTAVVEPLFKRPMQPAQRLPFSSQELDQLIAAWPDGQRALVAIWARVARIDSAGTLTRFLRRRAGTTPMHPAKNGAEVLLAAQFWSSFAMARLMELTQSRVDPVGCSEGELFELMRWLVLRQTDVAARLPASELLRDPRAGLIELAVELSSVPPRPQAGSAGADAWWARLADRAQRAEAAAGEPDYQKLQDNLRLFMRVLQRPDKTPPVYRALATLPHSEPVDPSEPTTLVALVASMRARMG